MIFVKENLFLLFTFDDTENYMKCDHVLKYQSNLEVRFICWTII
jgi:hypothetical protein